MIRRTSLLAACCLATAPLPAQAQYDGVYNGQVQCGPAGGQRMPVGTIRITMTGASFTYEVQVAGGGVERGSGGVTAPSLSAGGSASDGGVRYDGSYSGQIMPGSLWMTGAQSGAFAGGARGDRRCSISARR